MFSFWNKLTGFAKVLIALVIALPIAALVYYLSPGIKTGESKQLTKIEVSGDINNQSNVDEMPVPTEDISPIVGSKPPVRIAGYAWNAQSGIIVANGGPKTTKGSLMEKNGVNLELIRQDWLTELRNMQMKFIEEYDKGTDFPRDGAFALMIMGDGAPFYISSAQQALNDKYNGKYHLQVLGAVGLSYGEDKVIGPAAWKKNPQSMKGAVISAVIGDGDWVTGVNYAFANGLKVNPDPATYDAEAVNFYPSESDDYINSAKELIKSQKQGWTVKLKEVKEGKLTGKEVERKIDGCATWTPGDKMVFDELTGFTDIISTKEFNNQMATTIIGVKEWAEKHPDIVANILKSSYTASNQMKLYDNWRKSASKAVTKTFNQENPQYWYDMFAGQKGSKGGVDYNMGGSRVFSFADAQQYYGITDGVNRYKSVYDQIGKYLTELNPAGFNQSVKRVVPYEEAVNLTFLNSIKDIDAGTSYKPDYNKEATRSIASGEWHISFNSGSAKSKPESNATLKEIYDLLVQAENAKLVIEGHTDNVGDPKANLALSEQRAKAVKAYLIAKGIPEKRFQSVVGKGQDSPVGDNSTEAGKAKNRRVVISLLQ